MKIIVAVDEETRDGFKETLERVTDFADQIQIDFDDGSFGEYKTVSLKEVKDLINQYHDRISFEVHLMVADPLKYLTDIESLGARKVIIEAEKDGELRDCLETFAEHNYLIGLAVGPETSVYDIEPFLDIVDTVNVMTVEPGRQGQEFLSDNLNKVKELRERGFLGEIEVDGGINESNIHLVEEAGADIAVVGSYIVKAEDPEGSFDKLVQVCEARSP